MINNNNNYSSSDNNILKVQNDKKETVDYNGISNYEMTSIGNGSLEKDLKKIIRENNLDKKDLMDMFKMYFNLDDLKNLEKALVAKESPKNSNRNENNNLFQNKLNNVCENQSIELTSTKVVDTNFIELNSNKVIPDRVLKDSSFPSTKEWIAEHHNLVLKACYEKSSFEELINEIVKYSSSVKERRVLLEEIENLWDDKNVFDATILDNGTIIPCRVERFDF